MTITHRSYTGLDDYRRISQFLTEHYQPYNADGNWIEPIWEYQNYHPMLQPGVLERIRLWEEDGRMVSFVTPEWRLGDAFFMFHPGYHHLRAEMLAYAEEALSGDSGEGRKILHVYINDYDAPFIELVKSCGYSLYPDGHRPMYRFDIPDPFPPITLPRGFRLTSLAEECDWAKVHRVMWRGFNHPGEPPGGEEELEDRRKMFDTPSARRDLKIAVKALDGNFAAFCGMFYEPVHKVAYVEPVATDPDYRRMGLGRAAVLEGIRRCGELGAKYAYVGSDQQFYQAIGFQKEYISHCWRREFGRP